MPYVCSTLYAALASSNSTSASPPTFMGRFAVASTIFLLLASAAVIYLPWEYFVNGVEGVGQQFGVSKNATGAVLAAFGTAPPESLATFVAVAFGHSAAQKEIGVGSAIAGPLVLATVAYAVVGWAFVMSKSRLEGPLLSPAASRRLVSGQKWFMPVFVFKIGLGLVAFAIKPWLGILFLLRTPLTVETS